MASYAAFITARITVPDQQALLAAVRSVTGDATTVVFYDISGAGWRGKKTAPWTAADLSGVQIALDTSTANTPQLNAQHNVDSWPIEYRALALAIIDQLNVIRNLLVPPKTPDITPAQAIAAIRAKAALLA